MFSVCTIALFASFFIEVLSGPSCAYDKIPIPVYDNCSAFMNCTSGGFGVRQNCPAGQYFNCMTLKCSTENPWTRCCDLDLEMPSKTNNVCAINGLKVIYYCNQYDECVNGQVETKYCPSGLKFNEYNYTCMTIVSDCQPYPVPAESTSTTSSTTSSSTKANPNTVTSTTIAINPTCPIDNINISDSKNCTKYFDCSSGKPLSKTCPSGMYFNCINKACGADPWLPCCIHDPELPDVEPNYTCKENGSKIENVFNCGMYFECVNGMITDNNCGYGQDFSPYNHSCYDTTTGDCAPVVATASTTSTTNKVTTSTVSSTATFASTTRAASTATSTSSVPFVPTSPPSATINCPNFAIINNAKSCEQYYECTNGQPIKRSCPSDKKFFNCWKGQCECARTSHCCNNFVPSELDQCVSNKTIPDPQSCNNYFSCENGMSVKKYCSNGLVYDVWKKSCQVPTQGKCVLRPDQAVCQAIFASVLPFGALSFATYLLCPNK